MAGKGLYGVFYKPCVKEGDVTTGYSGKVTMMGKAVEAVFTPKTTSENPLYANNAVSENDASTGSGGSLALTLDRMTLDTAAALYGTEVKDVEVQVGGSAVQGKEIVFAGLEVSKPVGMAYIKLHQEDGVQRHEVMFYREGTFTRPTDNARTMEETVSWQTPQITASVMGMQGDGSEPWYRDSSWPTQAAAIAYIYQLFGETVSESGLMQTMTALSEEATT